MSGSHVTVELRPDLDAPALARTLVAAHGADLDPALVADAVLCVSEVVSNAVLHGRPTITLVLDSRDGGLGVEVTDHGDPLDVSRLPEPDDERPGGRGLHIVAALARAWGVRVGTSADHRANKTVWFELAPGSRGVTSSTGADAARQEVSA